MTFPLRFLAMALLAWPLLGGGAPVFEGIPTAQSANVSPVIPAGKTLLLPISVYDDAAPGVQPTITATSSNPYFAVRVKTGNPLLRMHLTHATPAIDTDVVFQLFDDLTPQTAGFMSGFAQSGYFDGQVIHRLANLNGSTTSPEYIFQGGDPLGNNAATAGRGGPGFSFDNEPNVQGIFTGRGQLAMANSGYNPSTLKGTNGSQFFITDSVLREKDFVHTIFGQLTHGWSALPLLRTTPVDANGRPVDNVNLTTASVSTQYTGPAPDGSATHTYTDAVLVLSAYYPGTATITVKCGSTTATFTVTSQKDAFNDPPFIVPIEDQLSKDEKIGVPFRVIDLEADHVELEPELLNNSATSGTSAKVSVVKATVANQVALSANLQYKETTSSAAVPYMGPVGLVLHATQWQPGTRPGYDSAIRESDEPYYDAPSVAIGTPPVTGVPVVLTGASGTALTNAVVARFQDSDRLARPSNYQAVLNWGDGDNVSALGTIAFSTAPGGYHELTVSGTNTYAKPGVYPLLVTLFSDAGWQKELRGLAVITAGSIVVTPLALDQTGATVSRAIATFTDSNQPGPLTAYQATVDWGDGVVATGTVRVTGVGQYTIYGAHTYVDPEAYGFTVRVHKQGAAASADAVVWSRLRVSGFTARPHLPPFSQAHVTGLLTPLIVLNPFTNQPVYLSVKETVGNFTAQSQTYLSVQLQISNSGNLAARASTLRLYLARGTTIRRTPVLDAQGHTLIPADVPLEFGPSLYDSATKTMKPQSSIPVRALVAGDGLTYFFQKSSLGDYRLRLPANEVGTGYNLIADLDFGDPYVQYEPVSQPIYGRIEGVQISPQTIQTTELGGSGTFSISLDRKPTADVTINLTGDATEGTLDKTSLTFTSANWFAPQAVKVTGIPDSALPSEGGSPDQSNTRYLVSMLAHSADPLYDGLIPGSVTVTNVDRDSVITVGAATGTLDTAPAASTAPQFATTAPNGTGTIALTMTKKPAAGTTLSVQVFLSDSLNGVLVQKGTTTPASTTVTFVDADYNTAGTATKLIYLQSLADTTHAATTVTYTVAFKATSSDPAYNGITPVPVTVRNTNP